MSTTDYRDPSVQAFCARQKISRAHLYNLLARGEGPRIYKIGRLVRVSAEAEAEWVRQREAAEAERATDAA